MGENCVVGVLHELSVTRLTRRQRRGRVLVLLSLRRDGHTETFQFAAHNHRDGEPHCNGECRITEPGGESALHEYDAGHDGYARDSGDEDLSRKTPGQQGCRGQCDQ